MCAWIGHVVSEATATTPTMLMSMCLVTFTNGHKCTIIYLDLYPHKWVESPITLETYLLITFYLVFACLATHSVHQYVSTNGINQIFSELGAALRTYHVLVVQTLCERWLQIVIMYAQGACIWLMLLYCTVCFRTCITIVTSMARVLAKSASRICSITCHAWMLCFRLPFSEISLHTLRNRLLWSNFSTSISWKLLSCIKSYDTWHVYRTF